jgi:phosphohistidine phosphatase SixA
MRDRLRGETRDILIAGHFPYLPRLLALLVTGGEAGAQFPEHGVVALVTDDEGATWREIWRVGN